MIDHGGEGDNRPAAIEHGTAASHGDGGQLTGGHLYGDSGHPYQNQIRGDDLRVFANSTDYRSGTESTSGRWSRDGAMAGGAEARRYGVLELNMTE